jgi:transglutaminase-like putative cysteine protease
MAQAFADVKSKLRKPTWEMLLRPLRLPEGWGTFALVALMVLLVQTAILRAEWAPELRILPSVTWAGLLIGFVLARIRPLPNYYAHLIGFVAGIAVIWLRTLAVVDDRFGGTRGKSVELAHRLGAYLRAAWNGKAEDDLFLFVLVCAALMYFFAYFSMWWIFRSHWLSPTLGVAGLILLINLGYDREDSGTFLFLFLLVVIPLAIRFYAFQQEAQWRMARIAFPDSLGWRFLSVATGLTLALLVVAYLLPFSVHGGPVHTAWEQVSAPWGNIEGRWEQFFPSIAGRGRTRSTFPGFAAFGDSFQLGGGLNLPEDPAVALKCDTIPGQYVKMNTYDYYTGHGFMKKVPDDFKAQQPDGSTYDPRVSLDASKAVPLPPAADQTAKSASCSAQLFRPRGNILPITGSQLEQINTQTLVSLGWQSYNLTGATIPPSATNPLPAPLADLVAKVSNLQGLTIPTDAPPTLRPGAQGQVTLQRDGTLVIYVPATTPTTFTSDQLAQLVARTQQQAVAQGAPSPRILRVTIVPAPVLQPTPSPAPTATGSTSALSGTSQPPTATPGATVTPQAAIVPLDKRFDAITQEQNRLATTLIQTQVVVENGRVTAILYRGQAPNFSDIDEVISTAPVPVGKEVTESVRVSEATEDMLRAAPAQLPKWTSRYTQLPEGITQRTADLAQTLAKGTTNQYDYAAAVEKYLRSNYLYQEKINLPPFDRDVTDYFLFQSKQGYGEYFSTAMLVLLRLNGVPAREVVGYLPGGRADDGRLVSLENQAHAWVEVYFPQYGWITFDPTPRPGVPPIVRGPQVLPSVPATTPDATATGDLAGGQDRLDARGEDRLRQLDEELNGGFDSGGSYTPLAQRREISPLFFVIPLMFGLLALVVAFLWLRTFRGMSGATQWYARMTRATGLAGLIRWNRTTTPFETAAAVAQRLPGSKDAAMLIAQRYAEERYAGHPPDAADTAETRTAWMRLRKLVVQSALPGNRRKDRKNAEVVPPIQPHGRRQR